MSAQSQQVCDLLLVRHSRHKATSPRAQSMGPPSVAFVRDLSFYLAYNPEWQKPTSSQKRPQQTSETWPGTSAFSACPPSHPLTLVMSLNVLRGASSTNKYVLSLCRGNPLNIILCTRFWLHSPAMPDTLSTRNSQKRFASNAMFLTEKNNSRLLSSKSVYPTRLADRWANKNNRFCTLCPLRRKTKQNRTIHKTRTCR